MTLGVVALGVVGSIAGGVTALAVTVGIVAVTVVGLLVAVQVFRTERGTSRQWSSPAGSPVLRSSPLPGTTSRNASAHSRTRLLDSPADHG